MTKLIKIGEVNFEKYKTEFFITQKTKRYLKEKNISLASLLPNGWLWYELTLFDLIKEKHIATVCIGKPHLKLWQIILNTGIFNQLLKTLSKYEVDLVILS